MDRFDPFLVIRENLLPYDGIVHYYGKVFSQDEADEHFRVLETEIEWQHDVVIIFGKRIVTKRKVAWYGDKPFSYRYSGMDKVALLWTEELKGIKQFVEEISGETFNTCLLNFYHQGEEGMGWHSDDEKELKKDGAIASLSFGAERKFSFRHRQTKERIDMLLEHGSLLLMKGTTQTHWLHCLPATKKISQARVNLTFRQLVTR